MFDTNFKLLYTFKGSKIDITILMVSEKFPFLIFTTGKEIFIYNYNNYNLISCYKVY